MGFASVRPYGFRNLLDRRVDCDAPEVFLIGDNGQGKTNFIEAVHVLCHGTSFRTRVDRRLVRRGGEEAAVEGILRFPGGTEIQILVNGKGLHDRAELLANIPCIVFSHEDFDFVTGEPERRRWFLNQTLGMSDPQYIAALRLYRRVLLSRNTVVRSRREELLDHYDRQLAAHGYEIQSRRERALSEFAGVFTSLFERVSGLELPVGLRYLPSWQGIESPAGAEELIRGRRELDLRFGVTTSGPHRDSYTFISDGREFEQVASTGQLRLCSLILRVAQAHYALAHTGKRPILLLDDVILELDARRKQAFVDNLPERDQAFFTFLSDESYASFRKPRSISYSVREGRLEACGA